MWGLPWPSNPSLESKERRVLPRANLKHSFGLGSKPASHVSTQTWSLDQGFKALFMGSFGHEEMVTATPPLTWLWDMCEENPSAGGRFTLLPLKADIHPLWEYKFSLIICTPYHRINAFRVQREHLILYNRSPATEMAEWSEQPKNRMTANPHPSQPCPSVRTPSPIGMWLASKLPMAPCPCKTSPERGPHPDPGPP